MRIIEIVRLSTSNCLVFRPRPRAAIYSPAILLATICRPTPQVRGFVPRMINQLGGKKPALQPPEGEREHPPLPMSELESQDTGIQLLFKEERERAKEFGQLAGAHKFDILTGVQSQLNLLNEAKACQRMLADSPLLIIGDSGVGKTMLIASATFTTLSFEPPSAMAAYGDARAMLKKDPSVKKILRDGEEMVKKYKTKLNLFEYIKPKDSKPAPLLFDRARRQTAQEACQSHYNDPAKFQNYFDRDAGLSAPTGKGGATTSAFVTWKYCDFFGVSFKVRPAAEMKKVIDVARQAQKEDETWRQQHMGTILDAMRILGRTYDELLKMEEQGFLLPARFEELEGCEVGMLIMPVEVDGRDPDTMTEADVRAATLAANSYAKDYQQWNTCGLWSNYGAITDVQIRYPSSLLRKVSLIDSPGFNEADRERDEMISKRCAAFPHVLAVLNDKKMRGSLRDFMSESLLPRMLADERNAKKTSGEPEMELHLIRPVKDEDKDSFFEEEDGGMRSPETDYKMSAENVAKGDLESPLKALGATADETKTILDRILKGFRVTPTKWALEDAAKGRQGTESLKRLADFTSELQKPCNAGALAHVAQVLFTNVARPLVTYYEAFKLLKDIADSPNSEELKGLLAALDQIVNGLELLKRKSSVDGKGRDGEMLKEARLKQIRDSLNVRLDNGSTVDEELKEVVQSTGMQCQSHERFYKQIGYDRTLASFNKQEQTDEDVFDSCFFSSLEASKRLLGDSNSTMSGDVHWSRYELHNRTSIHSEKLIITISPKELITCTISSLLAPVAS